VLPESTLALVTAAATTPDVAAWAAVVVRKRLLMQACWHAA